MRQRLCVGGLTFGCCRGGVRRAERAVELVRFVPMARQSRGKIAVLRRLIRICGQGMSDGGMETSPLPGQGILVDRFLKQRVSEPVVLALVDGFEEPCSDCLPESVSELGVAQRGDRAKDVVARGPAHDRGNSQDRARAFGQIGDLGSRRVAHRGWEIGAGIARSRELLGE